MVKVTSENHTLFHQWYHGLINRNKEYLCSPPPSIHFSMWSHKTSVYIGCWLQIIPRIAPYPASYIDIRIRRIGLCSGPCYGINQSIIYLWNDCSSCESLPRSWSCPYMLRRIIFFCRQNSFTQCILNFHEFQRTLATFYRSFCKEVAIPARSGQPCMSNIPSRCSQYCEVLLKWICRFIEWLTKFIPLQPSWSALL